ncbi:MAG: TRAP transporter substrate-binding protein [Thermoplasmata archaeon]
MVAWVLVVLGSFSGAMAADTGPRLVMAHGFGQDHPVQSGIERLRDRLAGTVTVEVGTWGDDRETVRAILAGELDAAVVSPAGLRDVAREVTLLDLIGLWWDRDHWARALDGEPGRQLAARVEGAKGETETGIRVLAYWGGTRRHLLTRREGVPTLEALATLRLGIPLKPVRSKMWKALGVRPILLSRREASSALHDGTVEGVEGDAETILRERLFEAAPHLTETGHAIATRLLVVGATAWRRLSRTQQAAVVAAASDATTVAREAEVKREADALASLRDRFGVTITKFTRRDALISRTRSIRYRYANEVGTSGLLTLIEQSARP